MPTKPMVKTLWLIIAAAFLIGLGLSGLGFALGGNAPVGFGPGGMRFVDFRTGTVYNARMEPRTEGVGTDFREGAITEQIDSIRAESVSADIRIVSALTPPDTPHGMGINYSIRSEGSLSYSISTHNGVLEIRPTRELSFFGIGNINWWGGNFEGEIIIEVPHGMRFERIDLTSDAGSINAAILNADDVWLSTISGSIDVGAVGDVFDFTDYLEVSSVSGRVVIRHACVYAFTLSQVSGASDIALARLDDFVIQSSSISAAVTVGGSSLGSGVSHFGSGNKSAEISTISGNITLTDVPITVQSVHDAMHEWEAIEIAEQDLAERGVSPVHLIDSGMGQELHTGQWTWQLLFVAPSEDLPLFEYQIDAHTGDIIIVHQFEDFGDEEDIGYEEE